MRFDGFGPVVLMVAALGAGARNETGINEGSWVLEPPNPPDLEVEARIDRKSFYRMVDLGQEEVIDGTAWFGIRSGGTFFPIIPSAELVE